MGKPVVKRRRIEAEKDSSVDEEIITNGGQASESDESSESEAELVVRHVNKNGTKTSGTTKGPSAFAAGAAGGKPALLSIKEFLNALNSGSYEAMMNGMLVKYLLFLDHQMGYIPITKE